MSWLLGYAYYKKGAVVATAAGEQTNYQLEIIVGEGDGAVGAGVHCNSHCQNFPNDMRFTKEDGITKHDYWIDTSSLEGTTPNRKVSVVIEVAYIPASGAVDFYMYYGKSGDSCESNGDNTFEFFDDFDKHVLVSFASVSKDVRGDGIYPPQGPVGIYVASQQKTYIVTQTLDCGRKIIEYNHSTKLFDNETDIGGFERDDDGHGAPALGIDADGYLYVFYGSHFSTQYYKKSLASYDITSWGIEQTVSSNATYPQVFYTDGKLWVLYRNSASKREWAYKTTSDGGSNWSAEVEITNFSPQPNFNCVYARTMKSPNGNIHMAWVWRSYADGCHNLYYAYFDISTGQWKKRDGTVLVLPIIERDAEKVFTGVQTWIWGLDVDSNNETYILFAYSGDDKIKLAKWKNSVWTVYNAIDYPFYPNGSFGALIVDSAQNMRVAMTSTDEKTARLYKSIDGGETWAFDRVIGEELQGKSYKYGAGFQTVFNANSELEFLFGPSVFPGSSGIAAAWGEDSDFAHYEEILYVLSEKWNSAGNVSCANSKVLVQDVNGEIASKTTYGVGHAICGYGKLDDRKQVGGQASFGLNSDIQDDNTVLIESYQKEAAPGPLKGRTKASGIGSTVSMDEVMSSAYRKFEIMWVSASLVRYRVDAGNIKEVTTNIPIGTYPLNIYTRFDTDIAEFDHVYVSKYASPEPTWGAWGAEEKKGTISLKLLQSKGLNLRLSQEGATN